MPGGLIGVGTKIDPTLTRADRLVGQVLGLKGHLPEVFTEVEISYYLLRRLLGVKTAEGDLLGILFSFTSISLCLSHDSTIFICGTLSNYFTITTYTTATILSDHLIIASSHF